MANFAEAFEKTMENEGDYANNPHDHGGETYMGISRKNWPGWDGWEQIDREKRLNKDFPRCLDRNPDLQHRVKAFYQRTFWTPAMENIENQGVAEWLFDKAVNMGIGRAYRMIQKAVGVLADGYMGPITMDAIKNADEGLLKRCRGEAVRFYTAIAVSDPSQRQFLKGWLNRA